jgi:hypothetical protein
VDLIATTQYASWWELPSERRLVKPSTITIRVLDRVTMGRSVRCINYWSVLLAVILILHSYFAMEETHDNHHKYQGA